MAIVSVEQSSGRTERSTIPIELHSLAQRKPPSVGKTL